MRLVFAILFCIAAAHADVINFDAQAAGGGGLLTGIPDSPLTIGIATFTGGELRDGEIGLNADATGVYATQGLFGSGESNPLVITFAQPVSSFSLFVANGDDARMYTVSDNLGDSLTQSLPSAGALGAAVFSLAGKNINSVDITSANAAAWDFAIDDVQFTPSAVAPAAVPEPGPGALLLAGLALLAIGTTGVRRVYRKLTTAPPGARL